MTDKTPDSNTPKPAPGLAAVVLSTLAAAFGVQSSRNRERDFAQGNFKAYVIAGLIFTVLFILAVATLARFAIRQAGG